MRRRQFIAAAGTGSLIAMAGCLTSARESSLQTQIQNVQANSEATVDGNRLQVVGTGQVEAEPNRATVALAVEARAESANEVRDALATNADALRSALIEYGIPDEAITTQTYSIRERRQESGYEGVHAFSVDIDDVEAVGALIDEAVAAGADNVGRIQFTVDDETRETLRERAIEAAIEDARHEAEVIADAQGLTLGDPVEIVSGGGGVSPWVPRHEAEMADDAAAPPTEIDEGLVTVSADIEITYRFS